MRRQQIVIFLSSLALIGFFSLAYSARVMADLTTLYQNPGDAFGVELVLTPKNFISAADSTQQQTLVKTQNVVARRLENLHLAGAYSLEIQGGHLIVKLPDHENMPYIASIISSVGEIEFIDGGAAAPPVGQQVQTAPQANPEANVYQTLFTTQEIEAAVPPDPSTGQIFYQLTLDPTSVEHFAKFIKDQPEHYICMVMDERVINCSVMYHWSGNTIEILPGLSSGAAISLADLGIFLDSGPLPMPFNIITH